MLNFTIDAVYDQIWERVVHSCCYHLIEEVCNVDFVDCGVIVISLMERYFRVDCLLFKPKLMEKSQAF